MAKKNSGIIEEILRDKEELILKLLELMEGKEAKAKFNLDGIEFKIGKSKVQLNGKIEVGFTPYSKKK